MSDITVDLTWKSGQRFEATNTSGSQLTLDGRTEIACSPTEALLSSVAACMGVDVVVILEKGRVDLQGLSIRIHGDRMADPPRYFHRMRLEFTVRGDVPRDKVERAVKLSFEKYCSVFHTLRNDLEIETQIELEA